MTLAVLWKYGPELWCAADTRISSGSAAVIDSGAKILPVPVVCRNQVGAQKYSVQSQFTLGFAFAGSTLTALTTHAISSACTQNLAAGRKLFKLPTVDQVAELFRQVGENCILDAASRTAQGRESTFFFTAWVFGWCRVSKSFKAFVLVPDTSRSRFSMVKMPHVPMDHGYLPMGSGMHDFDEEMKTPVDDGPHGVVKTMLRMIRSGKRSDVGGYVQIGMATSRGFELRPILHTLPGPLDRRLTFLGMDTTTLPRLGDYDVGYMALAPDVVR